MKVPKTFLDELDRQCNRISLVLSIAAIVVWLPYLRLDAELLAPQSELRYVRLGFSFLGAVTLLMHLLPRFKRRGLITVLILGTYLELATGYISGVTKGNAAYIGGYCLVLMLIPVGPLPRAFAWGLLAASTGIFAATAYISGIDLQSKTVVYTLQNLGVTIFLSAFFTYITDKLRFRGWSNLRESQAKRRMAEASLAEMATLSRFSKMLNEIHDVKTIVSNVYTHLKERFPIGYLALLLMDKDRMSARYNLIFFPDNTPEKSREYFGNLRIPLSGEGGITAEVVRLKRTVYLRNMRRSKLAPIDNDILSHIPLTSVIYFPLIIQSEVIGVLELANVGEKLTLTRREIDSIQVICDQIAGAVNYAHLLAETERAKDQALTESRLAEIARAETLNQKRETEMLNTLIKNLNEELDFKVIMQKVFSYVQANYGIEYYALYAVEKDNAAISPLDVLYPPYVSEAERKIIDARAIPTNGVQGAHALALTVKRPVYFPKIRKAGITSEELFVIEKYRMQSFLMIPLILQNRPIGILDFSNAEKKMNLSKDDIARLSILGEHLAGIINSSNLFKQVQAEKSRSEELLLNILPAPIARELQTKGNVTTLYYDSVSVMFTDFVGFTKIAETMMPDELVEELDGCFSQFDEVAKRNRLEKLKTIGDAYMCAAGLPTLNEYHAIDICLAALEFRAFMLQMQEIKAGMNLPFWQLRIGIHSGPVTAGVIGTNKFAYDIWGDTVNTASRMESSGEPGRINISGATYELVKDLFECEYRGKVKAKGKGEVDMYFLQRVKPELSADAAGLLPNGKFLQLIA